MTPRISSHGLRHQEEHGLAMLREAARTARTAPDAQPSFGSAKGRICRLELPWQGGRIVLGRASGVLPGKILYARHQNRFVVKISNARLSGYSNPILRLDMPLPLDATDLPPPTADDFACGIDQVLALLETAPDPTADRDMERCFALAGAVALDERPNLAEHLWMQVPLLHRRASLTATPSNHSYTWNEGAPPRIRRISPELAAAMRSITGDVVTVTWHGADTVTAGASHDIRIGHETVDQLLRVRSDPIGQMAEIRAITVAGRAAASELGLTPGPHILEPEPRRRRK